MPVAGSVSATPAAADALRRIDRYHLQGDTGACVQALDALAVTASRQPELLQELGLRYTLLNRHVQAERCYQQALTLRPSDPGCLYNHATALIALGRMDDAEAALDKVIAITPADGDAWYNRATLRRQTSQRNHIADIETQLERTTEGDAGQVPLCYALAKEREDLGEYAAAFAALKRGADARRQRMQYRVQDDLDTMQLIADTFDSEFFSRQHIGHENVRPMFVVGLPRSGTTLVDRILGSHGAVASRGESTDLAQALVRLAGPARDKAELVQRAGQLDFAALGQAYVNTLPAGTASRVIDKTPNNFLYLGAIAAALPQARIVHLRRRSMDACLAMYKTLFRMAYPFSYDLDDLARYWLGYDALMAHWQQVLPAGCLLEVDYEELVVNQETVSRRLIAHAGLDWDEACLHFEHNAQPTLTASAAQVRQPIYRSSVGLWRRYAHELAPLRRHFENAGLHIGDDTKTFA